MKGIAGFKYEYPPFLSCLESKDDFLSFLVHKFWGDSICDKSHNVVWILK
jgi:hypothetical protein